MADTSIDRLTLDIVVNNDNATRRINSVTKAIEKLNTAVSKSGNLDKVLGTINNVSPKTPKGGSGTGGGVNTRNLNIFSTLGKWNYYRNMARYYGKELYKMVQYAMDYVETQNLWQVANRNNLQMADEFIQKMNKAYGISEQTLMNYQGIFKNMLSALGGINEEVSSKLSMQLTQMAVDFSSLYNVSIPSAMQKFQAILSGQVRPIRSVSGYDITENTIFDLYQKAGGEKSMRQLNQLEKRLLRISAVFDQMEKTGALGDMEKTIESASNQARIMAEQTKETLTWAGQLVLIWMDNIGLLQGINATFMTMKEIIRTIAVSMGYQDKNFLDGLVTSSSEAEDAIDKVQGKLLSFDKFEALNPSESNVLGIDQTVLSLLENINYEMSDFQMKASEMSQQWLNALGFVDENGDGIYEMTQKAQNLLDAVKSISIVLGTILGYKLVVRIATLTKGVVGLTTASNLLNIALATGIVYSILKAVEAFKEGNVWAGILASVIGVSLVGAIVLLNKKMIITFVQTMSKTVGTIVFLMAKDIGSLAGTVTVLSGSFIALTASIAGAFLIFQNWGDMNKWQRVISVIGLATTAILGLAMAMGAFHSAWSIGLAVTGIVAGIAMMASSIASVKKQIAAPAYATGGFPEDGFFYANSGELVGQFSNGKTAVANNEQIVQGITQGVYSAMMAYNAQTGRQNGNGDVYLDGKKVGKVVAKSSHKEMVRTGLVSVNA